MPALSMLHHHRGGQFPARGFFNVPGVRFGFLSRPSIGDTPNPGSPRGDSDPHWSEKLARLFGERCRIIYIPGRHDGSIVQVNGENFDQSLLWQQPQPLISAFYGDAITLDYRSIPQSMRPLVAIIKTCDCGQWALINPKAGIAGLMHFSVVTAFGHRRQDEESLNTQGPITPRLLKCMGHGRVYVAIGASINGLRSPSHRCYPWGKPDAARLWQEVGANYPNMPRGDLLRHHPAPDKIDVNFGLMQLRVAEQHGLETRWTFDTSHNECTCGPEYYSMRGSQNAKDDPFISEHDKTILAAEAAHRLGQLAFVYLC